MSFWGGNPLTPNFSEVRNVLRPHAAPDSFDWSIHFNSVYNGHVALLTDDDGQKCNVVNVAQYLPHKVKTQYLHFRSYAEYFILSWKILELMSKRSILFHN